MVLHNILRVVGLVSQQKGVEITHLERLFFPDVLRD
jgi:hypothetical protein